MNIEYLIMKNKKSLAWWLGILYKKDEIEKVSLWKIVTFNDFVPSNFIGVHSLKNNFEALRLDWTLDNFGSSRHLLL